MSDITAKMREYPFCKEEINADAVWRFQNQVETHQRMVLVCPKGKARNKRL
jgi:hypothetical protein